MNVHELRELADDMRNTDKVIDGVSRVTKHAAQNIKTNAAKIVRTMALAHVPHYPRSINYDHQRLPTGAMAEIGPDKDRRQGALGNFIEYGYAPHNTKPHPHMLPATEKEEPVFRKQLQDVADRHLGGTL